MYSACNFRQYQFKPHARPVRSTNARDMISANANGSPLMPYSYIIDIKISMVKNRVSASACIWGHIPTIEKVGCLTIGITDRIFPYFLCMVRVFAIFVLPTNPSFKQYIKVACRFPKPAYFKNSICITDEFRGGFYISE